MLLSTFQSIFPNTNFTWKTTTFSEDKGEVNMNSTVFAVAVISSVVGAIFGVLVKHILDTRNFTEVCNWYLDEARKVDERLC